MNSSYHKLLEAAVADTNVASAPILGGGAGHIHQLSTRNPVPIRFHPNTAHNLIR